MNLNRRRFLSAVAATPFIARAIKALRPKSQEPVKLSMRFIRGYDVRTDGFINRYDVLAFLPDQITHTVRIES